MEDRIQVNGNTEQPQSSGSKNIHNLKLHIPKITDSGDNSQSSDSYAVGGTGKNVTASGVGSMQKSYTRSQSAPGNEAISTVRHRTNRPNRPRMQRQSSLLQRTAMIRSGSRRVKEATENFVGIGKNCNEDYEKWRLRYLRYDR